LSNKNVHRKHHEVPDDAPLVETSVNAENKGAV